MENYDIIKWVGKGAFGQVYLSRRLKDGHQVVIKKIPIDSITTDEKVGTQNEINVLSMLLHPNIIEYYDSFLENNVIMIVMEYASGGNLYDFLESRVPNNYLQEEEVLHMFSQLVLGIQHIHEMNICHRDLKTHNILLIHSISRRLKIGDFGISKIMYSKSKANTVVGTLCYMSPELCINKPYDQKSDIWALGCVLYEMLALCRAFQGDHPSVIVKIMQGSVPHLPSYCSNKIKSLVNHLLSLDPAHRPNINQIYSHPLIFPVIASVFTDNGMITSKAKLLPNERKENIPVLETGNGYIWKYGKKPHK